MEVQQTLDAMGTKVHIIVNGEQDQMVYCKKRLIDLENKWSRFLPSSEITQLNNSAGLPCEVSKDTQLLVKKALEAHKITNGMFDPTVLGDILRLGYTKSFEKLDSEIISEDSKYIRGASGITIDDQGLIAMAPNVGFDPGGIGKGLAADLIATEVMKSGADGVMINIGGDVRAIGSPPHGSGWRIKIATQDETVINSIEIKTGAVATSTTKKRTWVKDGQIVSHLIDPESGINSDNSIALASVVASKCWQAEILTKAIMIGGVDFGFKLVENLGAQSLAYSNSNEIHTTSGWHIFETS